MEYEEDKERKDTREKVVVPVPRHQPATKEEEEVPEEPAETKVWAPPRRWHVY